jgi:hypothetical protein
VLDLKTLPWDSLRSNEGDPDLGLSRALMVHRGTASATAARSAPVVTSAVGTFMVQYLKNRIHTGNGEFLVLHLHSLFLDDLFSVNAYQTSM